MFRTVNYTLFRFARSIYLQRKPLSFTIKLPALSLSEGVKLFVGSQICCAAIVSENISKMDIDDEGVEKALVEGDAAIMKLMDQLKEYVRIVSEEYRKCLIKQIEITEKSLNVGPLSQTWDDVPHYRTLADELNKELNEYTVLFNTIGEMAKEKSLVELVTDSHNSSDRVSVKFKELQELIQQEFDENKKIEAQLLKVNCDSILKGITS